MTGLIKNNIYIAVFAVIMLFLANSSFSQQYEDIVHLKNGSIIHGIITEQIPGESIKIKTKDGNTFVFKMDEIEKMTREEVVIKKEEVKTDSLKVKTVKTDTNKTKVKELTAKNSFTFQPIGLATLLTNFEFDRAISGSASIGLKVSFMTFLLRNAISFEGNPYDVENAELMKESLSAWGIGGHIRLYPGGRAIEGFFLGIAAEKLTASGEEYKSEHDRTKVKHTYNIVRLEFEIGNRIKLSNRVGGFTILWTLGAGAGFVNDEKDSETIPLGSIGFGIGYSF
jgi:hypothetical protein